MSALFLGIAFAALGIALGFKRFARREDVPRFRLVMGMGLPTFLLASSGWLFVFEYPNQRWHNVEGPRVARIAAMKTDLRNLITAQEGFFAANGDYAGSISADDARIDLPMGDGALPNFLTPDNAIALTYVDSTSWFATASTSLGSEQCGVYMGAKAVPPHPTITAEGIVECW